MKYTGKRISDTEFKRLHEEHIASHWWRRVFRPAALQYFGYRCAVCGLDYQRRHSWRRLIVDHVRYWKNGKLIFGEEVYADVRCMCPDCNRKGVRNAQVLRTHRIVHLIFRWTVWLTMLPLGVLWRTIQALTTKIRNTCSQTRPR